MDNIKHGKYNNKQNNPILIENRGKQCEKRGRVRIIIKATNQNQNQNQSKRRQNDLQGYQQ